jgi:uncharacterized protein YndB with AHSA1/START domain
MMMHAKKETGPVTFERVYEAPVEDLWALWTTKEGLEEWFTPEGCHFEVPVLDVREGGAFEHVMTVVEAGPVAAMEGVGRPRTTRARGRFVEVRPNERLHMQLTIDFLPGVDPYPYNIVVEFHPEARRVRMVVTADLHREAEVTRMAFEELTRQLVRFQSALARRR